MFSKQKAFVANIEQNLIFTSFRETLEAYQLIVKDYIIKDQLYDLGEDGDGKRLQPPYSLFTRRMKIALGKPADRVTLNDKGNFYANIEIRVYADSFEVLSNVSYDKYLIRRYGKAILKPSYENMKRLFWEKILPDFHLRMTESLAAARR